MVSKLVDIGTQFINPAYLVRIVIDSEFAHLYFLDGKYEQVSNQYIETIWHMLKTRDEWVKIEAGVFVNMTYAIEIYGGYVCMSNGKKYRIDELSEQNFAYFIEGANDEVY
jgi:hypothetical protein